MGEPFVFNREEHWTEVQARAEKEFLTEYHAGQYTPEQPYVRLNPYLIAPLTALVMFRTETPVKVVVTIHGTEPQGDISHQFERSCDHVLPVYGLYGGRENLVTIELEDGRKKELTIQTDPLPEKVKQPTSIETTAEYLDGNLMFVSPTTTAATAGYDYRGDCRWYLTPVSAFDIKKMRNGNLMIGSFRLYSLPYHLVGVMEMSMCGKIYKEFCLPDGYHHDVYEKEDGNLLILTSDLSGGTEEDVCALVDRESGEILKQWDLKRYLDPDRISGSPDWTHYGWFRNNALWFDEARGWLLLCGRFAEVIACIDTNTDELLWLLGDPDTWEADLVEKYFLIPEGDGFEWFYEPHSCTMLPNGDIFLFDNGHYRSKRPEKQVKAKDNYSRGVIYRIDYEHRTVRQIWQFGKERGSDFFSPYISNVSCYGENWYMVHAGGICWVNGEPSELISSVVNYRDPSVRLDAATVEIRDGKIEYEMHLPASFYRARKMKLYELEEKIVLGEGKVLGSLGKTEEFDTAIDTAFQTEEPIPEKYQVRLTEEIDRITLKALFEKGQLVMLVLTGEDGKRHNYYISTARHSHSTMCVATYLDDDERMIWVPVSKTGLCGQYRVSLIIDENEYDTGAVITA